MFDIGQEVFVFLNPLHGFSPEHALSHGRVDQVRVVTIKAAGKDTHKASYEIIDDDEINDYWLDEEFVFLSRDEAAQYVKLQLQSLLSHTEDRVSRLRRSLESIDHGNE